jgi:DNA-binding transcriptional ArsR family regulator
MENQFKQIAALIGDPVRATIMWTLMDGRAFTATELAASANTSPQNISMHLAKLTGAGLLCVESQGRHRYYKFARKDIAYGVEAMANLIPPTATEKNILTDISPIKYCRTCYDHLAGKVGVMITDSMLRHKIIIDKNNALEISVKGQKWFSNLDINTNDLKQERRFFVRPCLDWSERRHHMGGSLAAALLEKMLSADWMRRTKNSRAVIITSKGRKMLYEYLKISL